MAVEISTHLENLRANIGRVLLGKPDVVRLAVVALLAEGHVLIEDVPGVGKTLLAKAVARSVDCQFRRIQFTPDLLPSDIVGSSVFNAQTSEFVFRPGPIFANVVLADEINRTTPRTQSALLEGMAENQVTIDGESRPLSPPFIVLATQNPIEFHGTYPLPEAQLDRFLVQLDIGYPSVETEIDILKSHQHEHPLEKIQPVLSLEAVKQMQQEVLKVHVDDSILEYIVELVHASRHDSRLDLGISPRGSLMLSRAAQASAYSFNRDYVVPDDILWLLPYCLPHRILLTSKSRYAGLTKKEIIQSIGEHIKVPV